MDDGFNTLTDALAGFGHTLTARTRLTFGKDVAHALASLVSGGVVVVITEGATDKDVAAYNALITADTLDKLAVLDCRTNTYAQVRPNVATFLRSRKVAAGITPPRKDDDGNPVGFLVRKG